MKFLAKWRMRKPADDGETVYVSERFGVRSLHIGSDTVQSSMRLSRPNDLELAYTRSMMAFLLFVELPQRVLLVGLGGGSVAKFIYHRLPDTSVEVVEINPAVVAIARQCFHVPEDDERFVIKVGDGAERVTMVRPRPDVIAVDGYDAEAHVPELSTREFYRACRSRLRPGGMLVVNLWGGDRDFQEVLQRIEDAFPAGTLCLPAARPGNIIVLGFERAPAELRWSALLRRAADLEKELGLEFPQFVEALRRMNPFDSQGLLLRAAVA